MGVPEGTNEVWYAPLFRLGSGSLEWICHIVMVVILLAGIRLVEFFCDFFWGPDKLMFHRVPVRYVFDGADSVLLTSFVTLGVFFVLKSYYRKPNDRR